jgi:hypothetical protein
VPAGRPGERFIEKTGSSCDWGCWREKSECTYRMRRDECHGHFCDLGPTPRIPSIFD